MDDMDLLSEFGSALADLKIREREDESFRSWLARRGWTRERMGFAGGVGIASARIDHQRYIWEPVEDGERVFVVPCWDGPACAFGNPCRHESPLIDLVAWRPAEPARLYRRTGDAWVIGIEGVNLAVESGEPLSLFRSPEGYVRHGGERSPQGFAAVLVDPAAAWWALEGVTSVTCEDLIHAEEIDSLIAEQRPVAPSIRLPVAALETAA